MEEDYESDSCVTAAANKSLDMSRSLGKCCSIASLVDDLSAQSDEEKEPQQAAGVEELVTPASTQVSSIMLSNGGTAYTHL